MTYRGHIKNGVAIIDGAAALPDGTAVKLEVESEDPQFSQNKSVDQLANDQHVQPIGPLGDLAIDWPEEDSIDDLLDLVREARR